MKNKTELIVKGVFVPFLLFVFITIVVSVVYTFAKGITDKSQINAILVQGIADIFVIAVLWPLYLSFKKKNQITTSKFKILNTRYIFAIAFSICIISNIVLQYLPSAKDNEASKEIYKLMEEYNVFVCLLVVSVLVPIVEEVLFRGFFFDTFNILFGYIASALITSLAFGIIHMNIEQGIYGLVAGLFLSYVRYKYNNVIYSIFMHLAMNFCSVIFVPALLLTNGLKGQIFAALICIVLLLMAISQIERTTSNI